MKALNVLQSLRPVSPVYCTTTMGAVFKCLKNPKSFTYLILFFQTFTLTFSFTWIQYGRGTVRLKINRRLKESLRYFFNYLGYKLQDFPPFSRFWHAALQKILGITILLIWAYLWKNSNHNRYKGSVWNMGCKKMNFWKFRQSIT